MLADNYGMLRVFRGAGLRGLAPTGGRRGLRRAAHRRVPRRPRRRRPARVALRGPLAAAAARTRGASPWSAYDARRAASAAPCSTRSAGRGYAGRLHVVHPEADAIAGVPAYRASARSPARRPGGGRGAGRRGGRRDRGRRRGRRGRGRRGVVGLRRHGPRRRRPRAAGARPRAQRPARRPELAGRARHGGLGLNASFARRAARPAGWPSPRSRAASASRCSTSPATWASACTRSSRWAPSSTCPATTCWPRGDDDEVAAGALYLESFGNALKFARTARRFAERKPLLAVVGAAGPVGPTAHRRRRRRRPVRPGRRDRVPERRRARRDGALLSQQPLPGRAPGRLVSNAGGMGVLAAAGRRRGPVGASPPTAPGRLRAAVPGRSTRNPVDLGADVTPSGSGRAAWCWSPARSTRRRPAGADHAGRPARCRGRRAARPLGAGPVLVVASDAARGARPPGLTVYRTPWRRSSRWHAR